MNFKILEQWLTELMPAEHKQMMQQMIECIQENAPLQFSVGMTQLYPSLIHDNTEIQAAGLNGLLIGITLYHAWNSKPFVVETQLQGFLDYRKKKRGENIVDFFTERAKKK